MIHLRSGHIINIASLAGKNSFARGGIYCASKWGLLGLTQGMAEDLRQYGIRVSAICPGAPVATDFSPHSGKKTPASSFSRRMWRTRWKCCSRRPLKASSAKCSSALPRNQPKGSPLLPGPHANLRDPGSHPKAPINRQDSGRFPIRP